MAEHVRLPEVGLVAWLRPCQAIGKAPHRPARLAPVGRSASRIAPGRRGCDRWARKSWTFASAWPSDPAHELVGSSVQHATP